MNNFAKVIFTFASLKVIAWAIGLFILGDNLTNDITAFCTGKENILALVMLIIGIVGVCNHFLQRKIIYIVNTLQYSMLWVTALFGFTAYSISFYRTIPETIFIIGSLVLFIKEAIDSKK